MKKANICHFLGRKMLIMEVNLFTPEACLKCYSDTGPNSGCALHLVQSFLFA